MKCKSNRFDWLVPRLVNLVKGGNVCRFPRFIAFEIFFFNPNSSYENGKRKPLSLLINHFRIGSRSNEICNERRWQNAKISNGIE